MTTVVASIIALFAATCGVPPDSPDENDKQAPPTVVEEQHFCCLSVGDGSNGKGEGDGCTAIEKVNINNCDKVLFCPAGWWKDDGKVKCL